MSLTTSKVVSLDPTRLQAAVQAAVTEAVTQAVEQADTIQKVMQEDGTSLLDTVLVRT